MRRPLLILGAILAVAMAVLWAMGGLVALEQWAADQRRAVQSGLARGVRALKAGEAGALAGLMAVCFGYGFFHAIGPGHGKVLIGGYGVGRRVSMPRLAMIALASSLAQSAVAVVLVYVGILALGWTRAQTESVSEDIMAPVSYGLIAAVGVWLIWRGGAGLRRQVAARDGHAHAPGHAHDHDHAHCGHAHGPTLAEVERLTNWREALTLVAGVALRPCSGALFLLILTWSMGIWAAGVAGTFAMGLGTAIVTIAVAGMAVWAREGSLASLPGAGLAQAMPALELAAGLIVALVAGQLLRGAL